MQTERKSGILLHPTSLPGKWGMGEIGPEARRFVDQLAEMKQGLWQILPHGPTGYADSPYQSLSTFAGNEMLISFDDLLNEGLLRATEVEDCPDFPQDHTDYGWALDYRRKKLHLVYAHFNERASAKMKQDFETFCKENNHWLEDYALFAALKNRYELKPWTSWPEPLVKREPEALEKAKKEEAVAMEHVKIGQFLFSTQWDALRKYCHAKGIYIVGDIPIFVAHDSSDVWANPELFYLEENGQPTIVAGVPPDYFSATGQLWGNPLYKWEVHKETNYAWWVERLRKILEVVDIVRIDHFRGFDQYWEIPGDEETAINGKWVDGPRYDLFDALKRELGDDLPIIAEDLGVITPEVEALRDHYNLPGMRILQFAFGNDPQAESFRPHAFPENCISYTGTHDNDTVVGWFNSEAGKDSVRTAEEIEEERQAVLAYTHTDGSQIHWDLIALSLKSNAHTAITPLQDLMGLGSDARMNVPGVTDGNWQWRFSWDALNDEIKHRFKDLVEHTGRG